MKAVKKVFVLAILFASAAGVFAQQGFVGPGFGRNGRQPLQTQVVSVSEARTLANKTPVILTGNIVFAKSRERYVFQDATGEITVEIDRKVWQGLMVGPNDTVEIAGKMERKLFVRQIEVKAIRKI